RRRGREGEKRKKEGKKEREKRGEGKRGGKRRREGKGERGGKRKERGNGPGGGGSEATGEPKPVWDAMRRAVRQVQVVLTDEGTNVFDVNVGNETDDALEVELEVV
ncbi:hypothetical protein ACC689_34740, partial [Rhizobium ruizarguesonis]